MGMQGASACLGGWNKAMSRRKEGKKKRSVRFTRVGGREGQDDCHRSSSEELQMRRGYWIWENRDVTLILKKLNYEAYELLTLL